MLSAIDTLFHTKSGPIWKFFSEISSIPRPSKHEGKIREYLIDFAKEKKWEVRQDVVGNIAFKVPGCGRFADRPTLILQAHMDIVCEKDSESEHDFMVDPIVPYSDGIWVRSKGTTLGADNGIALALMLSLGEAPCKDRIPLELLITVDEETGLTGAMQLDKDIADGKMILNLDSEDEGILTIGCAGGIDLFSRFPLEVIRTIPTNCFRVRISGLKGGHSGVNIHENRGNAIIVAAQFLDESRQSIPGIEIFNFTGGNKKKRHPKRI